MGSQVGPIVSIVLSDGEPFLGARAAGLFSNYETLSEPFGYDPFSGSMGDGPTSKFFKWGCLRRRSPRGGRLFSRIFFSNGLIGLTTWGLWLRSGAV